MSNLYYKLFAKFGAALSARLYPDQIRAIEKAFDRLEAGEEVGRMPDSYTQFGYDMLLCEYYAEKEKGD